MLFTEECDKVRDLMHVHSFSYDFHLRVVHQYLLGSSMSLRQGYDLASFLQLFISQHPDIPKYGRNHVYQGMLSIPTEIIAAHQLYNYIADHASTYHMKPLRMVRPSALGSNGKKSTSGEQNEYGLVSIWNRYDCRVLHYVTYMKCAPPLIHVGPPLRQWLTKKVVAGWSQG